MNLNSNRWIVTERYNILLSGGTLLIAMIFLSVVLKNFDIIRPYETSAIGFTVILIGIWIWIFYKFEYIEHES